MLQTIKSNNLVKTMCSDCGKKLSEPLLKPEASKYSCITDPVRECAKTQSKLPFFFSEQMPTEATPSPKHTKL